ncbi:hypothetical protein GCM10012275_21660 [Longimycelium tulufanense]|uniref:DUF6545 domain-containing protein n=1 Tax=Longimycelium tulufanense TaxID=907463 RepID=A0A8J3CD58_9PSEU|nr:MAB_1171c family putative transporter [Longimycelium tulufanense]GGM50448.1 hypothetical protein GCM10012275_21660 [Longimycelium tulufanense]
MHAEVIRFILLVLCWTVVLVRIPAVRVREQRPLWFTLLMLGSGLLMLQKPVARVARELTGIPQITSLISSLMAVGVATLLLDFAIRRPPTHDFRTAPWRRFRIFSSLFTVVTMAVTFSITIAQGVPTRQRFLPVPGVFSAHIVYWVVYLVYMLLVTAWASVLFWRHIARTDSRVLRLAIALLGIATSTFLIFLGSRFAALFSASPTLLPFGLYISSIHSIGIAVGCSLAAVLPLIQAVAAWWHCYKLYPLWKTLCEALPNIALQPPRRRLLDVLTLRDNRLRLHRRLIEIRDGLLSMREWVTPEALDRIRTSMAETRLRPDQAEAATTACWLKVALRAQEQGLERVGKPLDLVSQGGADAYSELRWLRAVAAFWHDPRVDRCAAAIAAEPHRPGS